MAVEREIITQYLYQLLDLENFQDYGPNGLQVEGATQISKLAFAVSATSASVQAAVAQKAQALIVHHGLFWHFHGVKTITGPFAKRVKPLVQNDVNLYGLHLPLDAHLEVGNAASLARQLDLCHLESFGDYKGMPTGVKADLKRPLSVTQLEEQLASLLQHSVMVSSPNKMALIGRVGIITGGANSNWVQAKAQQLDAYITGEMSEHDWHEAQEAGMHMFAGGHHATEQFGIQSLMQKMQKDFADKQIECFYIPSENPA